MAKSTNKPLSTTKFKSLLAEATGITNAEAQRVLDVFPNIIIDQLKTNGCVNIPGVCKIKLRVRKATAERKMISPATKMEVVVPAKPACNVVAITAVKTVKDAVK